MKIVICPDSFKGSLTAREAAQAIQRGVMRFDPSIETVMIPIADGGEGTLDALVSPECRIIKTVHGTDGRPVNAEYGHSGDTAIIEMATAAGLCLVPEGERSAADASTYGVGELILEALGRRYRKLLITVGGSGTNDGGSGMLEALGAKFYDPKGEPIRKMCGRRLADISKIDVSNIDRRIFDCEIVFACDVTNPLIGESGATYVYGEQKGADAKTLDMLEAGMKNYADRLAEIGEDVRNIPGCGAGGGLAAPLLSLCDARILSGIEAVLSAQNYREKIKGASLVITGEGKIDRQSAFGKAISGVTRAAAEQGIPVLATVGMKGEGADELKGIGLTRIAAKDDIAPSVEYSLAHAAELLEELAFIEVKRFFGDETLAVRLPYGKTHITGELPRDRVLGVLESHLSEYEPKGSPAELIEEAVLHPIGSLPLCELAKNKQKVVIIASDHTRPVPSKQIIPVMLREIRKGNPDAKVTILIATGCHRGTTEAELRDKFGDAIYESEIITVHDCDDNDNLVNIGKLPSGGELVINKIAYEADLLVSEGFIEPHFFAGFSGGRKSVLPGVCSRSTVMYNHNAGFIADPCARTGVLENNPIHRDMIYAAKHAKLAFIVNAVLDSDKKTVYAVAGDVEKAHLAGCGFLNSLCRISVKPSDIVISTNGGYPLDQNIYQSVKGMSSAESVVKRDGVIIMVSKCNDGHGGESFYDTFRNSKDLNEMMSRFLNTSPDETVVDQWQSQIFARIMLKADVVFISDAPDGMVRDLHMIPAHSVDEALAVAEDILRQKGITEPTITVLPDGVSVIPQICLE